MHPVPFMPVSPPALAYILLICFRSLLKPCAEQAVSRTETTGYSSGNSRLFLLLQRDVLRRKNKKICIIRQKVK